MQSVVQAQHNTTQHNSASVGQLGTVTCVDICVNVVEHCVDGVHMSNCVCDQLPAPSVDFIV